MFGVPSHIPATSPSKFESHTFHDSSSLAKFSTSHTPGTNKRLFNGCPSLNVTEVKFSCQSVILFLEFVINNMVEKYHISVRHQFNDMLLKHSQV